jgi:carboxylesterase type B
LAHGDEDCAFLSEHIPAHASNLPVLVWIHGGGCNVQSESQDLSTVFNANEYGFVGEDI